MKKKRFGVKVRCKVPGEIIYRKITDKFNSKAWYEIYDKVWKKLCWGISEKVHGQNL